jgi:hypothetical protein
MVLLGNEVEIEGQYGLFGYSANLDSR